MSDAAPLYDASLNPRTPLSLWLLLAFGLKHLVCLHLVMQRALGEAGQILGDWRGAPGDVLVGLVAIATLYRTPGAPWFAQRIWHAAKPLLLVAYLNSLALTLLVNGHVLVEAMHPARGLVALLALVDALALLYVISSRQLPALFADFPVAPAPPAVIPRPANAALVRQAAGRQLLELHVGGLSPAERTLRQQLEQEADNAEAWHQLGIVAFQAGRLLEAVEFVRHASAIEGGNPLYLRNLAELCRRAGFLDESVRVAQAAVRLQPSDAEAHFHLGLALADAGQVEAARASYEQTVRLNAGHAGAWNNLGVILKARGRALEAKAAFERALGCAPGLEAASKNLHELQARSEAER